MIKPDTERALKRVMQLTKDTGRMWLGAAALVKRGALTGDWLIEFYLERGDEAIASFKLSDIIKKRDPAKKKKKGT